MFPYYILSGNDDTAEYLQRATHVPDLIVNPTRAGFKGCPINHRYFKRIKCTLLKKNRISGILW
jgi:hypothetical protein